MTRLDEQTLEELDGQRWAPPEVETSLAQTVHRLRRVPLGQFEARDLWVMIGQGVGLPYLIPKALALLERDTFVEADVSTGDLLIQVFGVDDAFWQKSPELRRRAVAVLDTALDRAHALDVTDRHDLLPRLVAARARFA
jgi:CDI immunity proteins